MSLLILLLLIAALVCFGVAFYKSRDLVALGLALWVGTAILGAISP
jgi:hypothetical protein